MTRTSPAWTEDSNWDVFHLIGQFFHLSAVDWHREFFNRDSYSQILRENESLGFDELRAAGAHTGAKSDGVLLTFDLVFDRFGLRPSLTKQVSTTAS